MRYKRLTLLALLLCSHSVCADPTAMEVIPLQNRTAAEIQPLLAPLLDSGDAVVDNGNSLIVKTSPARLETLQQLIKKLDTRPSNLVITVLQNSAKTAAQLNAEASPNSVQMRGLSADTRSLSNSQSQQLIRTLDGQAAHIQTGQVKMVQNVTAYGYGTPTPDAGNRAPQAGYGNTPPAGYAVNTQAIETSTGFAVTPHLSGNQVLLDVEPWSERFQQNGTIATQNAHTTLRVQLGEWTALASNGSHSQTTRPGINSFNASTAQLNTTHLLVKVDKAD